MNAAYGPVFTPFDSGLWRSWSRCHPLFSVSGVNQGFTEYAVCALPSVGKHNTASQKVSDQLELNQQPSGLGPDALIRLSY